MIYYSVPCILIFASWFLHDHLDIYGLLGDDKGIVASWEIYP